MFNNHRDAVRIELNNLNNSIAKITHSVNNLKGNSDELYSLLYKDKDSLVKRIEKVEETLEGMKNRTKVRTNLIYGLLLAFFSLLIPKFIDFANTINDSSVPQSSPTIYVAQNIDE